MRISYSPVPPSSSSSSSHVSHTTRFTPFERYLYKRFGFDDDLSVVIICYSLLYVLLIV